MGAVLLLLMLVSMWIQKNRKIAQDTSVRVAAVQSEASDFDTYVALTRTLTLEERKKTDIILWPEHAILYDVRRDVREWGILTELAEESDSLIVVGTQTALEDGKWYNTALSLNSDGAIGEPYKNHTVHFFDDGVAGTEAKAVVTPRWKMGTPICFDCDYQDVIRRMVADGAEFLMIPSMDGIDWGAKQHYQHAELFRHRAAENARWVVVAATSGVTQVIDPYGNRINSLPIIDEGVLTAEIGSSDHLTMYTRIGWLFPWITMCAGCVWVIWIFIAGIKEKRQSRTPK